MDTGITNQYNSAPDTTSPVGSSLHAVAVQGDDRQHRQDMNRIFSKLELLERELNRARNHIQQLETRCGLLEQRINSRLS